MLAWCLREIDRSRGDWSISLAEDLMGTWMSLFDAEHDHKPSSNTELDLRDTFSPQVQSSITGAAVRAHNILETKDGSR
jgi:hypothetical protein